MPRWVFIKRKGWRVIDLLPLAVPALIAGLSSCSPAVPADLDPRVPDSSGGPYDRAAYLSDLLSAGVADSQAVAAWADAHEEALRSALEGDPSPLPSQLRRYFHPRRPWAYAHRFSGDAGTLFVVTPAADTSAAENGNLAPAIGRSVPFFLELYRIDEEGAALIAASYGGGFHLDLEAGRDYVLLVQGALRAAGALTLDLSGND